MLNRESGRVVPGGWRLGLHLVLWAAGATAVALNGCGGQTTTTGDGDGDGSSGLTTSTGSTSTGSTSSTTSGSTTASTTTGSTTTAGSTTSSTAGTTTSTGTTTGSTTSGGGSGSGACTVDEDCAVAVHTDAACYSPGCSPPIAVAVAEMDDDPCLVKWAGSPGPTPSKACQYTGDSTCPAICAVPPACARAYCDADGSCALRTSQNADACGAVDEGCAALESVFNDALTEAQTCLAGGVQPTTECDEGLSVTDLCGCPHAASSEKTGAIQRANLARQAYQVACASPERCQLLDCMALPADPTGSCVLTEHPYGVCQFD